MVLGLSKSRELRPGVSALATIDQVRSDDFSLLPRRYVTPLGEAEAPLDLYTVQSEIRKLEAEHREAITEMDFLIEELTRLESDSMQSNPAFPPTTRMHIEVEDDR